MTVITAPASTVVLGKIHQNLAHDSYFYEITWDGKTIDVFEVWSTAYSGSRTSGLRAATLTECYEALESVEEDLVYLAIADLQEAARKPAVGGIVASTTKRGKNVGVTGTLLRTETNRYDHNKLRGQVKQTDGTTVWMDLDSLTAVDPEIPSAWAIGEAARKRLHRLAGSDGFTTIITMLGLHPSDRRRWIT